MNLSQILRGNKAIFYFNLTLDSPFLVAEFLGSSFIKLLLASAYSRISINLKTKCAKWKIGTGEMITAHTNADRSIMQSIFVKIGEVLRTLQPTMHCSLEIQIGKVWARGGNFPANRIPMRKCVCNIIEVILRCTFFVSTPISTKHTAFYSSLHEESHKNTRRHNS